ncbi:hypothetical protein NITGR_100023 [Nitrospina gracilis 3/211]|uniref:Uncharacterized protein n=1 Tax=Nitrospina gracilis (strain 3/211) TaxID=1266370 RepID=M1Z888_NITG3|nr:hypothetical protein NITGR_100023 [Nitrospina gracilis 3/211]
MFFPPLKGFPRKNTTYTVRLLLLLPRYFALEKTGCRVHFDNILSTGYQWVFCSLCFKRDT